MILAALLALAAQSPWKNGPSDDPAHFTIAVWLQNPSNAEAFKKAGINTYVGLYRGPTDEQMEKLRAAGMKVVCHPNAAAQKFMADPTIVAWMHGDEPDNAQAKPGGGYGPPIPPEKIQEDFRRIQASDLTRPVLLNLGQGVAWDDWIGRGVRTKHPEDYAEYLKGCHIASFDIYPAVHDHPAVAGKLEFVPDGVARLRTWGATTVWNCVEASRIDNVKTKPTVPQIRSEVWMSILAGSKGIIYFVHQFKPAFVEASLLRDPELLAGVTEINRQVRELAPVLNAPSLMAEVFRVTSSDPAAPLSSLGKRLGNRENYVFVCGLRDRATRATVEIAGKSAEVLYENRTIEIKDGRFEDEVGPYGVRLYRIR